MIITLVAIGSSVLTELITWINKKLDGTPLKGNGAFLVVFFLSIFGAAIKMFYFDHVAFSLSTLVAQAGEIFSVSQLYFTFIASKFGLTVAHE